MNSAAKLDRAFAGGLAWTAGVKYFTQVITWGALLVTARLLSPIEFGISAKASMFVVITNVLAEFGVGTAVLQMPELQGRRLRQMYTFSGLVCVLAFTSYLAIIPLLTAFFEKPGLEPLFAANGLGFLITGFQAVPVALLQREMDYRRISLAEATQALIQAAVTVACAWAGWGYWSLTVGVLAGKTSAAVLMTIWNPVSFARIHWREIHAPIRMGSQVAVGALAWSAYIQSDGVVVGRVLGDAALGMYGMAMTFASSPAEKTSGLLMRAAGPLFARVQKDLPLVRRYFLILSEMLLLVLLPLMLGLALVAREALEVILEPQWLAATLPLQWAAVYMTLRPLSTLSEQVLVSQHQSRFTMRMAIFTFFLMPTAFFIAAYWKGTVGVAASWLILAPLTIFPVVLKTLRIIHLKVVELLHAIWPAVAAAAVMVPAVYFLRLWMISRSWPVAVVLSAEVASGALVYGIVLLAFFRQRISRYFRFIKDLRGYS